MSYIRCFPTLKNVVEGGVQGGGRGSKEWRWVGEGDL